MSKKIVNPYREGGAYHRIFGALVVARSDQKNSRGSSAAELLASAKPCSKFDISVVVSPKTDKWGSRSAKSADYYCDAVKCKDDTKRFAMKIREKTMTMPDFQSSVTSKKSKASAATSKTKSTATVKAKARK